MTNPLVGVRGRVTFTVLAVSAVLFSVLGTIGFVAVADGGRNAIRERVDDVLDQLEGNIRAGSGLVTISTADGVRAGIAASGQPTSATSDISVVRRIEVGGTSLVLVGSSSQAPLTDSLRSLYRGLWIAIPLASVAAALMAGLATRRALRPVAAITALADTIGTDGRHGTDGARVPVPDTGDEVEHLARTVNDMLERIERGRLAQRRFTSDAAHELRTPLMALQGELELTGGRATEIDDATLARLEVLAHRLGDRIDDLVLLSTLDEGRQPVREPTSLRGLVADEAAVAAPAAVISGDDRAVPLDPRLMARAVRNLLANAGRHATQQVAATVEVERRADGDRLWLHVDDDGAGLDPARTDDVFQRFARLDEARSTDHGGSGLGLAIVASVAQAHGGGVAATTGPLGGARVSLWLPATAPAPVSSA